MSKAVFQIVNSPAEFFAEAQKVTRDKLSSFQNSSSIFHECTNDRAGDFHGSWADVLKTFSTSNFTAEASLTDDVIQDLATTDFSEVKWRFMQRLDEGDSIDVERHLAGDERCWTGCRRMAKVRQSVRIYLNFGGNCFRSAKQLAVAGAVGVTFAEIMESMGISAEIWAVHYSTRVDQAWNDYVHMVKLKAQNEYSDIGLINFFLGNDGVFRNGLFRIELGMAAKLGVDVSYGLGRSESIDFDMLGLTESERKTAIIVPQIYDVSEAKQWLKDTLADGKRLHSIAYRDEEQLQY